RVDGEVGVALPGAQLGIRQLPVAHALRVLLAERQRAQRLREQREALHPQGDLPGLGPEQRARHTDHIAEVEQLHDLVLLGPDGVDLEVNLNLAGPVLEVSEGRLAHGAQQDEPPREAVDGRVRVAESLERRLDHAGAVEPVGERDDAALYELGERLPPRRLGEAGHVALFLNWLRSFWHCTTMLVGRCVIRTAEDVLLTCCPPFPEARYTSIRRSSSLMSISMSSSTTG